MKYLLPVLTLSFIAVSFMFPAPALAWLQSYEIGPTRVYGFFPGLMHGFIAPFAVIAQLFDHNIVLYSSINNGFWYNFGFVLGISCFLGGTKGSCRQKKNDSDEQKFMNFLKTIGIIALISAVVDKCNRK